MNLLRSSAATHRRNELSSTNCNLECAEPRHERVPNLPTRLPIPVLLLPLQFFGKRVGSFQGYPGCVFTVDISPDGKRVAAAGVMASSSYKATAIKIWDLESGRSVTALEGHQGTIYSIAFSPDGAWLASGSTDGTARLWPMH